MTGSDQVLAAVELPSLQLPYADGVIVSRRVARSAVEGAPVDATRRAGGDDYGMTWVDFVPVTSAEAVRVSLRLATRPDLDAVVVHERYVPVNRTALAVAFATKLNRWRSGRGECPDVVTSAVRPDLSAVPGQVAVPHLVTVAEPNESGLTDRVVWEVMPPEVFLCWLPGMAGARRTSEIERRLPRLLRMRAIIRGGGIGRLPFGDEISAVLGTGSLTIRAVFGEPDLFLAAADYLYDLVDGDTCGSDG
jgi:hypothetical protein